MRKPGLTSPFGSNKPLKSQQFSRGTSVHVTALAWIYRNKSKKNLLFLRFVLCLEAYRNKYKHNFIILTFVYSLEVAEEFRNIFQGRFKPCRMLSYENSSDGLLKVPRGISHSICIVGAEGYFETFGIRERGKLVLIIETNDILEL